MPNYLQNFSASIGTAVGSFQRALTEARMGRRPPFLSAWANSARWNGGDLGVMDAAQQRAMLNGWVFTAVDMIMREVSAAELEIVEFQGLGKDEVAIPNHPFLQVMRRPNPWIGRSFLWQYTAAWLQLDGNAYWFLGLNKEGQLAEIWPLPSNATEPWPGDRKRFVDYYIFIANGMEYHIPSEYIVHFRLPNLFDIYRGMSRLHAGMLAIDADLAMASWNGKFFGRDNVMPSAVINLKSGSPDVQIVQTDLDQMKQDLRDEYGASARKTLLTSYNGGVDVNLLGWNAKDMDFLAGRQFTKDEIYSIFGVPGGLLDKNATEANANTADRVFKEKTIWPLLCLLAEQATAQITMPLYGKRFETRFKDIRPTNRQQEIDEAQSAKGILTIDEVRQRYYQAKPLPDGKGEALYTGGEPAAAEGAGGPPGMGLPPGEPGGEPGSAAGGLEKAREIFNAMRKNGNGSEPGKPAKREGVLPVPAVPAGKMLTSGELVPPAFGLTRKSYSGAMVGMFLPPAVSRDLALPPEMLPSEIEVVEPGELHLTLVYLGEVNSLSADQRDRALGIVANLAEEYGPVVGRVGGAGMFTAQDGRIPLYVSFDSPGLIEFRQELVRRLQAVGVEPDLSHGFVPHITLAYIPESYQMAPILDLEEVEIELGELTLAWAGERAGFFLGEGSSRPATKHHGPGPHPNGSPQAVHGNEGKFNSVYNDWRAYISNETRISQRTLSDDLVIWYISLYQAKQEGRLTEKEYTEKQNQWMEAVNAKLGKGGKPNDSLGGKRHKRPVNTGAAVIQDVETDGSISDADKAAIIKHLNEAGVPDEYLAGVTFSTKGDTDEMENWGDQQTQGFYDIFRNGVHVRPELVASIREDGTGSLGFATLLHEVGHHVYHGYTDGIFDDELQMVYERLSTVVPENLGGYGLRPYSLTSKEELYADSFHVFTQGFDFQRTELKKVYAEIFTETGTDPFQVFGEFFE